MSSADPMNGGQAAGVKLTARRVFTVCDACNKRAGQRVDQPFLEDSFIRELRARHDVRDPRHPGRRVLSPFAHGFTADGIHVAADEKWAPRIVSRRTIDYGNGRVDIIAADQAEADRLAERVQAQGKTAEFGQWRVVEDRPQITGRLEVRPWRWRRAVAKAALATGSDAFDESWRTGEDAARLRLWMRDPTALPFDHCPLRPTAGTALVQAVPAPANAIFLSRSDAGILANVVLSADGPLTVPRSSRRAGTPRPQTRTARRA